MIPGAGAVMLDGFGAGWSGAANADVAIDRRNADQTAASQGKILVEATVVDAAFAAFDASAGTLADRLVAGLITGADAGGDSRCGDQTATAAALLVAVPGDASYAETDAPVFGVDPDSTDVPFVIRQIDEGADTTVGQLRTVTFVITGVLLVLAAAGLVLIIRARRHRHGMTN
jgi:uncharacterized Ntn-hydrolase superfamily protein